MFPEHPSRRGTTQQRSQLWPAARIAFTGALVLFVSTIVIGILNGLDLFTPRHDVLMGHVHAGTLGWVALALAGAALLVFTDNRVVRATRVVGAARVTAALTWAVILMVAAFYAGDVIPGDRIARPITGAILLVALAWFIGWMIRFSKDLASTVARLGLQLAFASALIGAAFGIALGMATAGRHIPGLSPRTADAIAEAHPASMTIGFLLLAAFAMIEWLLGDRHVGESPYGVYQMWILFAAGIMVNIAFVIRLEDFLLPPANALMVAGVVMMMVRRRHDLKPSSWKGAGTGLFARVAVVFLVGYLVLLTVIVLRFVGGSFDVNAMSPEDQGLLAAFDHVMAIGVMTTALFGTLAVTLHGKAASLVDHIVLWGVTIGTAGFTVGLLLVDPLPKRIFTPIMGAALLFGVVAYLREMWRPETG